MSDEVETKPHDVDSSGEVGEDMHVHKPKPAHNLREFLTEIAVIVVGILIALSAEQVVEQLHWGERIRETHKQLLAETSSNASAALEWLTISPCLDQQLAALEQQVWQGRRSGDFRPPERRFSPTLVRFSADSWLNARSLQVSDHLGQQEVTGFTRVYFYASEQIGNVTHMHELAGELEPLTRPLEHVSPAETDDYIAKIGRIRELQSRMELASLLLIRGADEIHAPTPLPRLQRDLPGFRQTYGPCVSDPAETLRLALDRRLDDDDVFRLMRLAKPELG